MDQKKNYQEKVEKVFKKSGIFVLLFSLIIFAGGAMGFILKNSIPSLVMGSLFGLALVFSSVLLLSNRKSGIYISFSLIFLLDGFFTYRLITTQSFMPSGIILVLSLGMMMLLLKQCNKLPKIS